MDDNWTVGTATCDGIEYKFNVKHYDEPSEYAIRGGRVSKLWLAPKDGNFSRRLQSHLPACPCHFQPCRPVQ